MNLFVSGLVELLTWEENVAGDIIKIHRIDLSFQAAQALTMTGYLPRCFVPVLVAQDLLPTQPLPAVHDAELLLEEFDAWIDCGGFSSNRPRRGDAIATSMATW